MMFGFSKYTGSPSRPQEQQADTELQQEKRYHPDPTHGPTATQINQGRPFNCLSGGNEYDLVRDGAHFIKTVEWEMLDKRKFFPMSMMSSFTVRCFLYPLTLIRTRLQVQKGKEMYSGTYDAGRKILQNEGIRGLYRGFFVSAFQIVSGLCYVSTYEGVRHTLEHNNVTNTKVKAFVGGGCASIVGQTIIVPFDVISQHMMLIGLVEKGASNTAAKVNSSSPQLVSNAGTISGEPSSNSTMNNLKETVTSNPKSSIAASATKGRALSFVNPLGIQTEGRSKGQIARDITVAIYKKDGIKGYYRGYFASICTYVPSSASWWTFYQFFQDIYGAIIPVQDIGLPNTVLQCGAAMSSGCATCIITNPLDLVRTRVQVQRRSFPETAKKLWRQERFKIFTKGLSARMTSSVIYSVAIIFGYETVKKYSVLEEYKSRVLW